MQQALTSRVMLLVAAAAAAAFGHIVLRMRKRYATLHAITPYLLSFLLSMLHSVADSCSSMQLTQSTSVGVSVLCY